MLKAYLFGNSMGRRLYKRCSDTLHINHCRLEPIQQSTPSVLLMWLYLNILANFCLKSLLLELMRSLPLVAVGIEQKGCLANAVIPRL